MATERKRSAGSCGGHIPAFGGWDAAADLPITQYFESARHAGLSRNPSERVAAGADHPAAGDAVLPATKRRSYSQNTKGERRPVRHGHEKKGSAGSRQQLQMHSSSLNSAASKNVNVTPKPVDEDLYGIPPELLRGGSRRKFFFGFFSRCLAPSPCTA
ncbi:unnamed protein product [Cuscuta epithymum]|uniref:RIN4 pathogenic type III effector avirulence factor Avr cleavage site domain-containing protein n=1 Tax=Cuscuta epithymum TaxID=186058 RepID=A0AAV0FJV2_9ASTE|nr:unnamed protein product [Cuscuta epithymum]CAH9135895.1 unnamed protein product [Cuscuta epithymum]